MKKEKTPVPQQEVSKANQKEKKAEEIIKPTESKSKDNKAWIAMIIAFLLIVPLLITLFYNSK